MGRPVKLHELREAIAEALRNAVRSYQLPAVCEGYGLAPGDESDAHYSKRMYVLNRIGNHKFEQLVELAYRVVDDYGCEELERLLARVSAQGVRGEFRNLIFAANGPKPQIVLRDSVNNVIEIVRNAEFCLVYDRPLGPQGLTWRDLVSWWMGKRGYASSDELECARDLYKRLSLSLQSPSERLFFGRYGRLYSKKGGFGYPALIPQVYLHYDPYSISSGRSGGALVRQRMDFLLLLPNRVRVVIEIDGMHHYSVNDRPDPCKYSEMVAEDRELRLAGYDVYRFGGYELVQSNAASIVDEFLRRLLARCECM